MTYPPAPRGSTEDLYHDVRVADPYRWLEDADTPEVQAWIAAENSVTEAFLATITEREALRDRLTQLWNYPRWGTPSRHGARYVVAHNDGLAAQYRYYTLATLDAEPQLLLDPNRWSEDGTIALSQMAFSKDGEYLAYSISKAGSDWQSFRVRSVATATDLEDVLEWVKFSGASWSADGLGFYYSRYDAPTPGQELAALNYDQKLYYHRLGALQADDRLVYARPDEPEWGFDGDVTEDGRYLIITIRKGTDPNTSIAYQDLRVPEAKRVTHELLPGFSASWTFVGNAGPVFWFHTDADASRGRILAIDARRPDRAHWQELVPERPATLESVRVVGRRFVATYLDRARSRVELIGLDGRSRQDFELPGIGSAYGFTGRSDHQETFFGFDSLTQPSTIFRYDFTDGAVSVFRKPDVAFDPGAYETHQVDVTSRDGTVLPMFIAHRKGLVLDGNNPTYLYGYGGFNISLTPHFSVPNLLWMELGGVFAMPNLRGGGEFGEAWHQAGIKQRKQNVFDDFIAAAEWLIAHDYTRPARLAIGGRSNGGLLVGAAMTQRPELFGAALPGVGVMDMLRFNKFTIGWAWQSDYGSPEDPDDFAALFAYSPYHNLRRGTAYPATLIYTADHDDRVVPAHSFKFAAALQWAQAGDAPVLIRIDTKAGHGAGKPVTKQIDEWTDLWGFLVETLDMDVLERPSATLGTDP